MRFTPRFPLAFCLCFINIAAALAQVVAPPPLPDVKNPGAVNPATTNVATPTTATGKGFFDDALVATKTTNSVFAELSQLPSYRSLTTEEARKAFAQKYLADRVNMLLKAAAELSPGKLSTSLTESDNQKIDLFANQMAKGTYKIQELPADPGFQTRLAQLVEHLKTISASLEPGLGADQQVDALSRDAQDWLVKEKIVTPGTLGTNDQAILNDLARMVLAQSANPPAEQTKPQPAQPTPTEPAPQPTGNRVAQHQRALREFLQTLPQTLLNRGGPQNYGQLRDQMLNIALTALQQQFLGGQALTGEEQNQVVGLVDQALKPFESLVGRILNPQYPPNIFQPGSIQPITTQPVGLQPTMISPYSHPLTMPGGFGTLCPILGYPGLGAGLPAFGFGLGPFRR